MIHFKCNLNVSSHNTNICLRVNVTSDSPLVITQIAESTGNDVYDCTRIDGQTWNPVSLFIFISTVI